ncbi:unnamed protein product [Paramecium octaurelia]|uniref:Uncharacterized protein n=1 Tax=Paramecium octaurelia TaxID=43137 RepID=A0A8S1U0I9_PAROT|nr:unnamed protein product [Paramecium octaurelia]
MLQKRIQQCFGQIVKQQIQKAESLKQMLDPKLEKPMIVTEQDKDHKYVQDYTKSPSKMEFVEEDPLSNVITAKIVNEDGKEITYTTNTKTTIEMKHNPLALKAMTESQVAIDQVNVVTMKSNVIGQQFRQADLGSVFVMPENTVHISEVDVNNIPADKDIQLDREEKVLYAIGTKSNEASYSDKLALNNTIIEDVTFQEYKDKYLYKIEQPFAYLSRTKALKKFVRWLPIYFVMFCFLETWWEMHHLKKYIYSLEVQELDQTKEVLHARQIELLLNDPLFKRF